MKHIYHVQHEVMSYYQHIPHMPDGIMVNAELLFGLTQEQFTENFSYVINVMKKMYIDMQARPGEYGLPLIDIDQINENKADGNLAKASWRSIKRLGDIIEIIGKLGEINRDSLEISISSFKASAKKINKAHLILNRMIDSGFKITNFNGDSFYKAEDKFSISYPNKPFLMRALKAYASSEPFHTDDPHEFYYFDYKRIADRQKLPKHCVASDLAALIDEDKGKLLININKRFVDELGFMPHYRDDSIEYYIKKKRVARFIIDFHNLEVMFILKLKEMDRYIDRIGALPERLRSYFENGSCRYCGFQGATEDFCKFRINWTLDNQKIDACNFACFNFSNPESCDSDLLVELMQKEYNLLPV